MNPKFDLKQRLTTKLLSLGFVEKQFSSNGASNEYKTYRNTNNAILKVTPIPKSGYGKSRYTQIFDIVEAAKELGFCIHVVSRGVNLGYGGEEPYDPDCVIINLKAFNNISNYDHEIGQITIEPGVTQEDIFHYLKKHGAKHIHDTTGAPKYSSVVGNYLDRGFGHTPMAEHTKNILNAHVIIPDSKESPPQYCVTSLDGTIIKVSNNNVVRSYTIGPDYTQLFIQSNLGIVTNLTIKLLPVTQSFVAYFVPFKSEDTSRVISLCAKLRRQGTIHSASHIGNAVKTLQMIAAEHPSIIKAYDQDNIDSVIKNLGLDDWTISGGIYGTKNQVKAHIRDLKKEMKRIGLSPMFLNKIQRFCLQKLSIFSEKHKRVILKGLNSKIKPIRKLSVSMALAKGADKLCDIKQGKPTNYFLKSIYWRNLHKLSDVGKPSPIRDNVGLIWGAPCAKLSAENFVKITSMMKETCDKYKVECPISVTMLNERTIECVLSLSYDRLNKAEENNTLHCYQELMTSASNMGFTQYRMSTLSNVFLNKETLKLDLPLLSLKDQLDPCGVISPLKYKLVSG